MATTRRIRIHDDRDSVLERGVADIRRDLDLPDGFPRDVEVAAADAVQRPRLPAEDRTDLAFITIDPPESMDLDQAMHVQRRQGGGFRVHYAIADVAAFVSPGDPVDLEANRRGETLYGADSKIPLHPKVMSQGAASLLPDRTCPALLWTIDLDSSGEGIDVDVHRALVRSRAKLNYSGVQQMIDAGNADPVWDILREIGELRMQREADRGGISLALPEQEIHVEDGRWQLEFRARREVELCNEQISLLTGMAAAHLMVDARVGLLRTLPEPPRWAVERLHRTAKALDIDWPDGQSYPAFISSLDGARTLHVAMLVSCTTVLRGAGYAAFDGAVPEHSRHSALAAQYAHTTAPLRRLVDRYVGEACVAICAGKPVPEWVLEALPGLPGTMQESGRRANRYEREVLSLAEAFTLQPRIGELFDGAIVDVDHDDANRGDAMIREPAIEARVTSRDKLPLGARVKLRLVEADPRTRTVEFELAE